MSCWSFIKQEVDFLGAHLVSWCHHSWKSFQSSDSWSEVREPVRLRYDNVLDHSRIWEIWTSWIRSDMIINHGQTCPLSWTPLWMRCFSSVHCFCFLFFFSFSLFPFSFFLFPLMIKLPPWFFLESRMTQSPIFRSLSDFFRPFENLESRPIFNPIKIWVQHWLIRPEGSSKWWSDLWHLIWIADLHLCFQYQSP